jgi:hypothetical protein
MSICAYSVFIKKKYQKFDTTANQTKAQFHSFYSVREKQNE